MKELKQCFMCEQFQEEKYMRDVEVESGDVKVCIACFVQIKRRNQKLQTDLEQLSIEEAAEAELKRREEEARRMAEEALRTATEGLDTKDPEQ